MCTINPARHASYFSTSKHDNSWAMKHTCTGSFLERTYDSGLYGILSDQLRFLSQIIDVESNHEKIEATSHWV